MANPKQKQPTVHHYFRSFIAGLFGAIALLLVSFSILLVWANRTLTDTPTYVATVRPLISQPKFENFVADQVTTQILNSAPLPDLASTLIGPSATGQSQAQLQSELKPIISSTVVQVMSSSAMASTWDQTNQSLHASFISQLNSNQPEVNLDFGPFLTSLINQIKQTKLAPAAAHMNVEPSSAVVTIKGTELEKIHSGYNLLKTVPFIIVFLTLLFGALSIWISVHHQKTFRRMLIDVGVSSLLVAAVIELPVFVKPPASSSANAGVAIALVHTLLGGLQTELIILGIVAILLAIGSKVVDLRLNRAK